MDVENALKEYEEENKELKIKNEELKRNIGFQSRDLDDILSHMTPEALLRIRNGNLTNVRFTTCDILDKIRTQNKELIERCECLKTEIAGLKSIDNKIIADPIRVAGNLIYAEYGYEMGSFAKAFSDSETRTERAYSKSELRQIAEHILVCCNSTEESK